ncbi:MAG: AAA family ATPase [Methanosarcinales archaeon]|nr:MAG: AAA family ATPase [Methanosarcinales archaeon]
MPIRKIRVTNFKSFKELEVELGKFNVLIGANASGKSNFVQIFKFLRDITDFGLDNAISMQGGVEYLRNVKIGRSEIFSINVVSDKKFRLSRKINEDRIGVETYKMIYEFAIRFKSRGTGYEIVKDKLIQKCIFNKLEKRGKEIKVKEKLGKGEIILSHANGKVNISLKKPEKVPINKDDMYPPFLIEKRLPSNRLLLETIFFMPLLEMTFSEISLYDFDPKLPKKATPITGKAELEEDGANLSIVLKNILEHKDEKRKLFNLVKDILPFIDDLGVEKFADKSLLFKLREIYSKGQYLPASLISDGTINVTALIVALYFEKKPLTIIEEPGRNIHPHLISKVMGMMKDASRKKQIIVTTHNPEIIKYACLDDILLVSRDKDGFSTVSRPGDKEEVKIFLKNEIGIEELYVQNLLGV